MSQSRIGLLDKWQSTTYQQKIYIGVAIGVGGIGLYLVIRGLTRKKKPEIVEKADHVLPRYRVPDRFDRLNRSGTNLSARSNHSTGAATTTYESARTGLDPSFIALRLPNDMRSVDKATPMDVIKMGHLNTRELKNALQKALGTLELVRNRSERDKTRVELLSSVVDRMKFIETDLYSILQEGMSGELIHYDDVHSTSQGGGVRASTLSVLSDDSFMSAVQDFGVSADDDGKLIDVPVDQMLFLKEGMEATQNGLVKYRRDRTEFCQCEDTADFTAKLYCLRVAFEIICADEHKRLWLANAGRQIMGNLLKHSRQDPSPFFKAFDDLMQFLENEENLEIAEIELEQRGVAVLGFWDVVLDFILLDAFEDLMNPPSSIYSVTKNTWLSESTQYSTISTVVWSMLKAKRRRLANPNGFIGHFYNISEAVSPAVTLGILGTNPRLGELYHYFKEQVSAFAIDIFNKRKVRYTSPEDLAEDVWVVLETRTEAVSSRLSTELVPV